MAVSENKASEEAKVAAATAAKEPPLKGFQPRTEFGAGVVVVSTASKNDVYLPPRKRSGSLRIMSSSSPGRHGRRSSVSGYSAMMMSSKSKSNKSENGGGCAGSSAALLPPLRALSPSKFAGILRPFWSSSASNSTAEAEDSPRHRPRSGSFNSSDVHLRPPAYSVCSSNPAGATGGLGGSYIDITGSATLGRNFRSGSTGSSTSSSVTSDVLLRRRHPSTSSSASNSSSSVIDREAFFLYDESDFEEIECLLPNGIVLNMNVHPDDEVFHIKRVVLSKATTDDRLPLRGCLEHDVTRYALSYISQAGRHEECFDESVTLREMKPFKNILKFSMKTREKQHTMFKINVGKLIGKNLLEFDDLRNCEVNDFRWRQGQTSNRIARERKSRLEKSITAQIMYQYPPRIVSHPNNEHNFGERIPIRIVWDETDAKEEIEISADSTPVEVLKELASRRERDSEGCFLKVIGQDSFLVGDYRLIDFEYVRERIMLKRVPQLIVVNEDSINIEKANETVYHNIERSISHQMSSEEEPAAVYERNHSLTAINLNLLSFKSMSPSTKIDKKFCVTFHSLKLPPETAYTYNSRTLGLQLGVFHGRQQLCSLMAQTVKCAPNGVGVIDIQKTFEFDISIHHLPRNAKLCLGVCERKQYPLFWVNSNVFDYKAKMKWKCTMHMWNYTQACTPTYQFLSPLRQSVSNPDMKEAASVVVSFQKESESSPSHSVEFPVEVQDSLVASAVAAANALTAGCDGIVGGAAVNGNGTYTLRTITKLYKQELKLIGDRDPLHDLTEQEKDLIWKLREYCLTRLPELLPRIVDCVDYSNQTIVVELHSLLSRWPVLSAERALQLLDYAYPDQHVRRFAVRCLRAVNDDTILRYLLQLAQALKHESFFQCDLVEFLLERALNNQHIGHSLFWELKAEMNSPAVGFHYGLILEAYLSAAPEHLMILMHTNILLDRCRATRFLLLKQETPARNHDKARSLFERSVRQQFDGFHPYGNFVNPLDPGVRCRKIILPRCRLMNSKMRPQMMAFDNVDSDLGRDLEDVVLMYKKGDDLRQDRLTLQLLKVMDLLWKDAGLDLRMNVYRCMSTDINEGFIEVVGNAETICKIQMAAQKSYKSTAAFRKGLLLSWMRANNPGTEKMRQAQWEFTQSCAGYSVAMYILGIGDRHNDNIMVKRNGQLFHIDFGHFLGNFKYKFGFKRERVPMVLSSEFVDVIKADFSGEGVNGGNNGVRNFERFRSLCEAAFMTIRKDGSLIISLLAMMISTGLPELSSEQDLTIIRSTLHLDRTEEEALKHFRNDFNESLRSAWTISLDWWFHMMNQLRYKGVKG